MRQQRRSLRTLPRGSRLRRGLAPLELVFGLPLLLCMMALIVNIGTATKWKLRTLFAVREAAWSQRSGRYRAIRPPEWPAVATYEVLPGGDDLFPNDPYARYPVVRGPVLQDPQAPRAQLQVDTNQLKVAAGLFRGHARIDRATPMLPRITGIHYDLQHLVTESRWRFQDMGYGSNESRRITRLYQLLPPADASAYSAAAQRILNSPSRPNLVPLDQDREFLWWNGAAPDFYPRLMPMCSLDPLTVRKVAIEQLVQRIKGPRGDGKGGVPDAMGRAFRGLYGSILADEMNGRMKEASLPPPPDGANWQQKRDDLQGFP